MARELDDAAVAMERVLSPTEKNLKKSRKGGEDCAMEAEIYNAIERVLLMIEVERRKAQKARKDLGDRDELDFYVVREVNLDLLKAYVLNMVAGIIVLAPEATASRWRETTSQIDTTGSSVEFESHKAHADSGIGGKLKKMLLSIHKSGARSTEVPKGSFEWSSISSLVDQTWDNGRQLQQLPTEAQFLSLSMLTENTLAHHVASLELSLEYIVWLCIWVPEFFKRLQRIKKDDEMGEDMMDGAEIEEALFADYKSSWERVRRRSKRMCFEDSTTLSSMLFTHYMPGHHPLFADFTGTMQICSIKITDLEGFKWPLEVYGVVAARDVVDYRRNHLFLRSRDSCQFLTEKDSFLHLTGPSRAIISTDRVSIEIQLKVKGTMESEDSPLITKAFACEGDAAGTSITRSIHGCFCRVEFCFENLRDSIQATILSIRVMKGSLHSASNGVQVTCFSLPEEDDACDAECRTNEVVLLDRKAGAVHIDEEGYLELSRQTVSVQFYRRLEVVIETGTMNGCAVFKPNLSSISQQSCILADCELEITVAWSLVVNDEQHMLMMSYTKPVMVPSSFPFMKLVEGTG